MPGFDSNTKLLAHFDGADGATAYTAETGQTITFLGNAQLDTAQKEFGASSLLLDGVGDYATVPHSADFNLGSSDFTLDFWVRWNTLPVNANYQVFFAHSDTSDVGYYMWLFNTAGTYSISFRNFNGSSYSLDIKKDIATPSTGVWYHIAVVRNGSNFYIFLNGAQQGTTATDTDPCSDATTTLFIGANRIGEQSINGWIDEFRLSNTARWTNNFTPPAIPYNRIKDINGVPFESIKTFNGLSIGSIKNYNGLI